MAVVLKKGGSVSLRKADPTLKQVVVGLGWDPRLGKGGGFDLDAAVFLLTAKNKVSSAADMIFYNQPRSSDGSVEHTGDNRTGEGTGDDEQIKISLQNIPNHVQTLVFTVTIHDAQQRGQNFGQVRNAFIRLVNAASNQEVIRYDLSEDYSVESSLVFGELYRDAGEWQFRAGGQGMSGGLEVLCRRYGVDFE